MLVKDNISLIQAAPHNIFSIRTISSISLGGSAGNRISGNAVKPISKTLSSKFSGLNLFGYELRASAGWGTLSDVATSFFGRIGFSSYVTYTQGQPGMLYSLLVILKNTKYSKISDSY